MTKPRQAGGPIVARVVKVPAAIFKSLSLGSPTLSHPCAYEDWLSVAAEGLKGRGRYRQDSDLPLSQQSPTGPVGLCLSGHIIRGVLFEHHGHGRSCRPPGPTVTTYGQRWLPETRSGGRCAREACATVEKRVRPVRYRLGVLCEMKMGNLNLNGTGRTPFPFPSPIGACSGPGAPQIMFLIISR